MANRTMKYARTVKGTNPQYLVEKIIRTRVYDSRYWKEECFALNAEILVDKAMELDHIGGVFSGSVKPTPFLCLTLKMLQIQPTKDIVVEFIKNPDYKYVRLLGAFYMRLTGNSLDCYNYLEPLYNDYRKVKRKKSDGVVEVIHVDQFIDELLRDERSCDVILPRIQKRQVLEETGELQPRVSALDDDLSDVDEEEEEEDSEDEQSSPDHRRSYHSRRSRSPSPAARRRRSPSPRGRRRSPSPQRRRRSRSPAHHRHHSPSHHRRRSHSPSGHKDKHSRRSHDTKDTNRSPSPKRHSKSDKSEKKSKSKPKQVEEDDEIRQANALRKSLGIKPLRTD